MARDASRRRSAAGHTLLELLVVLAIIGILSGIAGVASGVSGAQHLDMAEVQIRDAIEWAQAQAHSNRSPVGVVFDPAEDRFAIVDASGVVLPDPLTHAGYEVSFHRPNQPRLVHMLSANFGAGGHALIFDAQGAPMTGGTIRLQARGVSRVLTVDAATGSLSSS
jgi:prepilin-type N-terminal cleavage/methylation domain-containing protein